LATASQPIVRKKIQDKSGLPVSCGNIQPSRTTETGEARDRRYRKQRYAHSGHAPFREDPDRFNAELAAFARDCFGAR